MAVLFIFVLSILYFVSGISSIVVCSFYSFPDYHLPPVDQIPQRCGVISYGHYYLDMVPQVSREDLSAIDSLHTAGKPVFVRVTFQKTSQWFDIMNSMTEHGSGQKYIDLIGHMIDTFIKVHQIDGVILDALDLFNGNKNVKPDYATKLNDVIKQMKEDAGPELLLTVGIIVDADQHDLFGKLELFNFTTSNREVNHYVIDMNKAMLGCNKNTALSGRFPIKGGNMSQDAVNSAVTERSGMAKEKLMINLIIKVTVLMDGSFETIDRSYNEYCGQDNHNGTYNPDVWCKDSTQNCHFQAKNANPHYSGIMLSYLDLDDYDTMTCNCGFFPIANAFLNGWENKTTDNCPKLGH